MKGQDIAITGMACVFPGARDLRQYWENIVEGVDAVSDAPEEWEAERFFSATSETGDKTYCKRGGFLNGLAQFDPVQFGIMPGAVDGTEPDHFLALATASEALADAHVKNLNQVRERTAVIIGRGTYVNRGNAAAVQHSLALDSVIGVLKQLHPEYETEELDEIRRRLKESLPAFHADTAPGLVPNIISGRIANRLDLMGPNFIVDAACASSLIAIDLAVRDLRSGRCDMAIAGGVHASTPPVIMIIFSQLNALSRKGAIRPFDADADGTLLGEGAGMVVLKRLEDAERDGDRVYAVLKGVGSSSDGRALGLLAPRVEGEELALRRAYQDAGVEPETVALLEAHGTATKAGDVAEVKALNLVFGKRTGGMPSVALGSVKSMIGHTMPASGMAGLIKAALSLHHKVLPPTLHCENPNPGLDLEHSRLYLNAVARPWIHGLSDNPRRAGVNAFGFGGVNAHAVLEEYTGANPARGLRHTWGHELFIISAASRDALVEEANRLDVRIAEGFDGVSLKDLAWSVNRRPFSPIRLSVIASSLDDLQSKLRRAITRLNDLKTRRIRDLQGIYFFTEPLAARGKVAFIYPGEGAQYPNMLADLCMHFPRVRAWFDRMDRAFAGHARNFLPSQVTFPPPGIGATRLFEMDAGAEAVFCANQALDSLIEAFDIRPAAVAGHSTGEHTALLKAGIVPATTEAELLEHIRGVNAVFERLNAESMIAGGVLATVAGASHREIEKLVEESQGRVHLALDNCPHQMVLCGHEQDLDPLLNVLVARGAICQKLAMARAYHTPEFEVFTQRLKDYFDSVPIDSPRIPVWSCATAARFPEDPDECRALASVQCARTVRFRETVEAMHADGVRIFVEVGPRGNLTAFVDDILRGKEHTAISANTQAREGLLQWQHMLGELVAHGVPARLDALYENRDPRDAFAKPIAKAALPMKVRSGLQPMRLPSDFRVKRKPAVAAASAPVSPVPGVPDTRTAALLEQLNTMQQFLTVQQQVMGAYLSPRSQGRDCEAAVVSLPPFIDKIIARETGSLVAIHRFDLNREKLFSDHTLGRRISESDPTMSGLPVVPLTVTMEILAEAASLLAPGMVLTGMRNVRAYRWITLEKPAATIEISAEITSAPGQVQVRLREHEGREPRPLLAEGVMLFAASYPKSIAAEHFSLRGERRSQWTASRLYSEGMFHGKSLQGTRSMDRVSPEGALATLVVPDRGALLDGCAEPAFLMDPVVLDNAGQAVAFWSQEELLPEGDIFPYRLAALDCFAPPQPSGTRLECRIRATHVSESEIHSDIEIVDASGHLHYRLRGWEDRRFTLPQSFWKLRIAPADAYVSAPWAAPIEVFPEMEELACRRIDNLSLELLESSHGIWLKVLAYSVLSRRERAFWESMTAAPKRKVEWLLGRCAAKDAVRSLLLKQHQLAVCPADVEIEPDERGQPLAGGAWKERLGVNPVVSIAHSHGCAVALAALRTSRHVGIDLEWRSRPAESFVRTAFTADERTLLSELAGAAAGEWPLRLWCAKEAVSKGLGHGLGDGVLSVTVGKVDALTGLVEVNLRDALLRRFPQFRDAPITAYTAHDRQFVFSSVVYTQEAAV